MLDHERTVSGYVGLNANRYAVLHTSSENQRNKERAEAATQLSQGAFAAAQSNDLSNDQRQQIGVCTGTALEYERQFVAQSKQLSEMKMWQRNVI